MTAIPPPGMNVRAQRVRRRPAFMDERRRPISVQLAGRPNRWADLLYVETTEHSVQPEVFRGSGVRVGWGLSR